MKRSGLGVVIALAMTGCGTPAGAPPVPLVVCLGDSITFGVTRSSAGATPAQLDPEGGYPARLAVLLEGRARVRSRGVGGATTAIWLSPPSDGMATVFWEHLRDQRHDLPSAPPPGAPNLADAVLSIDRPDVVVVLLGVNDLHLAPASAGAELADAIAERLRRLRAQALTRARSVLVSTLLPNHRDPPALREAVNARIRTDHVDFLPLAERFAEAGWEQLLGDEIHPNERGYAVLASALAGELERRGLVPAPRRSSRTRAVAHRVAW